ncbi:unnamed protein product [Allacma fusca]|uniref:Uncharacterized protein n=1 Tax=Allacma fusca TaxID=39272 RepID=A0A8J2Q4Q1_9HEXA|nr:unnamed protein product [Allacma fusca]
MSKKVDYSLLLVAAPVEIQKKLFKKYHQSRGKTNIKLLYGGVVSLVATILAFFVGVPVVVRLAVQHEFRLQKGSLLWDKWESIPVPVYLKLRLFNITNPNAIQDGEKFKLKEVGPYTFEEKRTKTIVEINEEEDTVTYDEVVHYYFRPELSVGSLDDAFTIPNLPYLAVAKIAKDNAVAKIAKDNVHGITSIPLGLLEFFGETYTKENVSVRELVFGGMEVDATYAPLAQLSPSSVPTEIEGTQFALLLNKNGSKTGQWKIKSGIKDISTIGKIVSMDGKSKMDYWADESSPEHQHCNQINGSDGTLQAPLVTKDRTMEVFHPILCRSLRFNFNKETSVNGIKAYQFKFPQDMFASPDKNPANQCFCKKSKYAMNEPCVDGGYYLSACKYGAPIVVTKPHFADGEKRFFDNVEGLSPGLESHETEINIEPTTGIPLKASVNLQFNIEIKPLEGISSFENVPYTMLPIIRAEMTAVLSGETLDMLQSMAITPLRVAEALKWILIISNVFIIIAGTWIAAKSRLDNLNREIENSKKMMELTSIITSHK